MHKKSYLIPPFRSYQAAHIYLYTAWTKFQLDSINDHVSIFVKVPKDAAPAADDKKKKKKKKGDASAPTEAAAAQLVEKELSYSVRRVRIILKNEMKAEFLIRCGGL